MSELESFIEENTAVPETEPTPEPAEPEVPEAAPEPEPEPEATPEPEGSTAEPDKQEKPGEVPIAALLDEREKRQNFEKRVRELETQLQTKQAEKLPDVLDDQEAFVNQLTSQMQSQRLMDRIEISQEFMRMQHDDYAEAELKFAEMAAGNPALVEEMKAHAFPAKFAYETAKKAEKLAQMENVDEWEAKKTAEIEARVKAQLEAEIKAKAEATAKAEASLAPSLAAQQAAGKNNEVVMPADPLDTTFNR